MYKKTTIITLICVLFAPMHVGALDIQLADSRLQDCVNTLVKKNKWQSISDITKIQCHNKGVESLEGIEQFSKLQKLSLHKNKIKKVILKNFQDLKEINIARNKLSEVELSNLPKLETLYLFGNRFSDLELNNFPKLKQLKANSAGVHYFHYSNLPSLQKIYMFDNQMETIDIHSLPALIYMDVRQNPMPDELYEEMDKMPNMTILHDGNAEDWQ